MRKKPILNHWLVAFGFGVMTLVGLALSVGDAANKATMQWYAISLCVFSITVVAINAWRQPTFLMSCNTVVILAPLWFLYLEAVLPGGDCWLLPADAVTRALAYAPFFLMVFSAAYFAKPNPAIVRFHDKHFLRVTNGSFLPIVGIGLTVLTFFAVLARYGFSWETTKEVYLAGRAAGSGLIRRGGLGGIEVFLQPLDFMCASVPTIAALSWVAFPKERLAPFALRLAVTGCAVFLIFVQFLGGSRGFMATYLAGPAVIWIIFGRHFLGKAAYILVTVGLFLTLIAVWEYQKRNREHLLADVESVGDIVEDTTFNPTKAHRDNNLYVFTLYTMYMPSEYPYAGYNDFLIIITNPIPRAIWPGKPKGIQASKAAFSTPTGPPSRGPVKLGTASLSHTIVGSGYVVDHYFGIALYAAIFGLLASGWDRLGQSRFLVTKLYFILQSAWLFWMLWGFRSSFAWITGMYPVWGAYVLCYVAGRFGRPYVQRAISAHRARSYVGPRLPGSPQPQATHFAPPSA
jgi:hypothetical protein